MASCMFLLRYSCVSQPSNEIISVTLSVLPHLWQAFHAKNHYFLISEVQVIFPISKIHLWISEIQLHLRISKIHFSISEIHLRISEIHLRMSENQLNFQYPKIILTLHQASALPFKRIPFSKYQYASLIFKVLSHLFITILRIFQLLSS